MLEAMRTAFPSRKIKLVYSGIVQKALAIIWIVIAVLIGGPASWWFGHDLISDYRVSKDPVVVMDVQFSGKCQTQYGILSSCGGVLKRDGVSKKHIDRFIVQIYFGMEKGTPNTLVLMERGNPESIALAEGVDRIWNRIFTWFVILFWTLFLLWRGIRLLRLSLQAEKLEGSEQKMTPIVVKLGRTRGWSRSYYTYSYERDGKEYNSKIRVKFAKDEKPLMINPTTRTALAVCIDGLDIPVLLDSGLKRIDLNDEERMAFLKL